MLTSDSIELICGEVIEKSVINCTELNQKETENNNKVTLRTLRVSEHGLCVCTLLRGLWPVRHMACFSECKWNLFKAFELFKPFETVESYIKIEIYQSLISVKPIQPIVTQSLFPLTISASF